MTKIPFYVNFANIIETEYRERCNWSETVQMTYNARKKGIELVFLGPKLGYDSCPYLSFFVRRVKRRSLRVDGTKILKY